MNIGLIASFIVIVLSFLYTWTLWRKVAQGVLAKKDVTRKAAPVIVVAAIGLLGMFYFVGAV